MPDDFNKRITGIEQRVFDNNDIAATADHELVPIGVEGIAGRDGAQERGEQLVVVCGE